MFGLLKLLVCVVLLCSSPLSVAAEKKSVTFINPGGEQGFWGNVTEVMREASRQLHIDLEVLHSNRNRLLMLEYANKIADRDTPPDVVIIVNELEQGSELLKVLGSAEIPVYFLLNKLSDAQIEKVADRLATSPGIIGSIVPGNYTAGYEMLKRVVEERLKQKPGETVHVLAVLGDQLTPAALEREAGMRQAIAEMDNVELVRAFPVLWDPDTAFKRVVTATSMIDFDVVWAANDALAIASRNALRESCAASHCEKIPVVGLNWSPEGLDAISRGELVASHGGHFTAGGYAIAAICNHLQGDRYAANVALHMESIDVDRLAQISDIVSTESWNQLDFTMLADSLTEKQDSFEPLTLFTD